MSARGGRTKAPRGPTHGTSCCLFVANYAPAPGPRVLVRSETSHCSQPAKRGKEDDLSSAETTLDVDQGVGQCYGDWCWDVRGITGERAIARTRLHTRFQNDYQCCHPRTLEPRRSPGRVASSVKRACTGAARSSASRAASRGIYHAALCPAPLCPAAPAPYAIKANNSFSSACTRSASEQPESVAVSHLSTSAFHPASWLRANM